MISRNIQNALNHKAANWLADSLPDITSILYRVKLEGADLPDKQKPAVFAFKHQHLIDFLMATYVISRLNAREKATIMVKRELFEKEFFRVVLGKWNAVPVTRPWDEGYELNGTQNLKDVRRFLYALREGGWYLYAPEGTRCRGMVAENVYVRPLQVAAQKGVPTYFVGAEYTPQKWFDWMPMWLPLFATSVTIRIAPYDATGKTLEQIAAEFRSEAAKLSGLRPEKNPVAYSPTGNN